jgi:hypothetical protein
MTGMKYLSSRQIKRNHKSRPSQQDYWNLEQAYFPMWKTKLYEWRATPAQLTPTHPRPQHAHTHVHTHTHTHTHTNTTKDVHHHCNARESVTCFNWNLESLWVQMEEIVGKQVSLRNALRNQLLCTQNCFPWTVVHVHFLPLILLISINCISRTRSREDGEAIALGNLTMG